jgi:DNA-binding CsgD family transcriptional regulator
MATWNEKAILARLTAAELRFYTAMLNSGEHIDVIAERLGITRNTARNHVAHILQKTGCESRVELMHHVYSARVSELRRQLRAR